MMIRIGLIPMVDVFMSVMADAMVQQHVGAD